MRILITGSTGFIGGALARQLIADGHDILEIIRDGEPIGKDVVRGDIRDPSVVSRAFLKVRPEVTFHLAAQALVGRSSIDPIDTITTNMIGTTNMLESFARMRSTDVFILASSDKAYGEGLDRYGRPTAYKESDPMDGRGIYDASKSCADLIARSYAETYSLDVRCARMGNVYGPGDREMSRIVPSIVDDIVNIRRPTIRSDGTPVRDYLYIDDAVSAYVRLMGREARSGYDAYNFAGGEPVSVLELVQLAMDSARRDTVHHHKLGYLDPKFAAEFPKGTGPEILGERGGEIQHQMLSCHKARRLLGWEPSLQPYYGGAVDGVPTEKAPRLRNGLAKTIREAWLAR